MNASVKVKLCNSLLAFVLVVGLCIPTFGVDAYAEPENELQGTPITESFEMRLINPLMRFLVS